MTSDLRLPRSVASGPEVLVAAVEPVIDPAAVRLIRDGGAVPQVGEPCLGAGDGVEDFGQRPFSAGRSRRACMAYLVSYPWAATSSGRLVCAPACPVIAAFCPFR